MKKCIVISDSFKGSLPSRDICAIARERIPLVCPACEVRALSVADGGEGTVDCFLASCGGERVVVSGVQNPYGEPIDAAYGLLPDGTAVVEMAAAAGLPLVAGRKIPCVTTTYGVGQLIEIAAERGRKTRPGIKLGICGEQGGDPATVEFCYKVGFTYVSCSPFRVPIARLATAHAVIKNSK